VFAPQARHLIRALLAAKRLEPESPVQWRLQLTPRCQGAVASGRVWRNPYPLELDSLPDRPECSLSVAAEDTLLDAVQRRVVAAGATECAGMLLGRVRHDLERRAVLVSLQDEIPLAAGAGGASQVHFSFDPASWVRARLEASRREDGLVPVGWVHSHPPCGACFEQTACPGETVFFSASDEEVHAAAFPSPFMVGLVAGKLRHLPARRPGFRLYGWSRARIVPIPIEVSGPGADAFRAEVRPVTPEED
ncbi:MAG: Mov34/MPN/PAD-1 family protein, partial [Myxococcota bacterium]